MIPELGHFCLIITLCMAALQLAIYCSKLATVNIMRPIAIGQAFFVCCAFGVLAWSFLNDDFTLPYVAFNSNSSLPFYFKFTAMWGAHEGSLLLWIFMLNFWALLIALSARKWELQFSNALLVVFAVVNLGFISILLFLSNPFMRNFVNVPLDGMDLNPLLQDLGMIIHPPILYAGYVGCTVGFAFAIAALLNGKLDQAWARLVQPWVAAAWLFLTLGIALGSWWAYYELGWGGWWFWDPVENASFMPWLTATALLHCLAVAKKKGHLLLMALFLCIATFALSLLGTFLVRSGSIISVHAFASDPQRGLFILQFLAILLGGSIFLYSTRAAKLLLPNANAWHRNDTIILVNNILLLVATGTVLLGTFFPLIYDALFKTKIAVGYPYFNAVFVPLMLILFAFMLYGLISARKSLIYIFLVSASLAALLLFLYFGTVKFTAYVGLTFALAIIATCLRTKNVSMALAHLGLAVTIIGVSITPAYEIERDVSLQFGHSIQLAGYDVAFNGIKNVDGPNYIGFVGEFDVLKNNKVIAELHPEKRMYLAREMTMTETAILPSLLQDIYIALGQEFAPGIWSARIYYKPFVRWIWLGAIIMACGVAFGIGRKIFFRNDHIESAL